MTFFANNSNPSVDINLLSPSEFTPCAVLSDILNNSPVMYHDLHPEERWEMVKGLSGPEEAEVYVAVLLLFHEKGV